MQILVLPSASLAARAAAQFVARTVRERPASVLGLPTGRTMIPVYRDLVDLHRRGRADFRRVTTFNLDEFVGLAPGDAGSFRAFMRRCLFSRVNVRESATRFPSVGGATPGDYDNEILEAGGLDLTLLGVGVNGHVGFNEPAPKLKARTHRVRLLPATRRANAYLFERPGDVPQFAVSMGIATILNSRAIVMLATGRSKAGIVGRALAGPVTTQVPASLIQTHSNALVVLDRSAAAALQRA